ncbi:MAG: hypothetical protein EA367_19320 [Leptolyngbya sp. DLM2.Bin15]|nr:MAG: hypothetical protein EA367_19320 [Leptolyngbya sp. DLM2.Bin15]
MPLRSSWLTKLGLVTLTIVSSFAIHSAVDAQARPWYRARCSFYGQNQPQASSIGCSVSQTSTRIVIEWDDGIVTTLELGWDGVWRSLPSQAGAQVNYYAASGEVAQVEIFSGPGQGLISINP